jgi:hypothetical protein
MGNLISPENWYVQFIVLNGAIVLCLVVVSLLYAIVLDWYCRRRRKDDSDLDGEN